MGFKSLEGLSPPSSLAPGEGPLSPPQGGWWPRGLAAALGADTDLAQGAWSGRPASHELNVFTTQRGCPGSHLLEVCHVTFSGSIFFSLKVFFKLINVDSVQNASSVIYINFPKYSNNL